MRTPPRALSLLLRGAIFVVTLLTLVGGMLVESFARGMSGFGGGRPNPRPGCLGLAMVLLMVFCLLSCFRLLPGRALVVGFWVVPLCLLPLAGWTFYRFGPLTVGGWVVVAYTALWMLMCYWRLVEIAQAEPPDVATPDVAMPEADSTTAP